jgi:prepilin-type N-terminal cleavage/methylation domain-containing protein
MKVNSKGFSLIELIIVIAIMAVLVAIIAPNLTRYLGKSKVTTDKKNLDEIKQQTHTCISEASVDNVEVILNEDGTKIAVYVLGYNNATGKTVASIGSDGTQDFADILSRVFAEENVSSKVDTKLKNVEITISGQKSSGYTVNVRFIS